MKRSRDLEQNKADFHERATRCAFLRRDQVSAGLAGFLALCDLV
jgi:hypothetical protein